MPESILITIKKLLGIDEADTAFDVDVIIFINSIFLNLKQIGIGPDVTFSISNKDATWASFSTDLSVIGMIKTYISLKARLMFDPPSTSFVITAIESQVKEMEYRLQHEMEMRIPDPIIEEEL